jgi:D-proline reductase (dithiol) PrdB
MRDLNIVFPLDRLGELVARGELGGLGPRHYSFMGAQRDVGRIERETGPEVGRQLRADGVDLAFITPT